MKKKYNFLILFIILIIEGKKSKIPFVRLKEDGFGMEGKVVSPFSFFLQTF